MVEPEQATGRVGTVRRPDRHPAGPGPHRHGRAHPGHPPPMTWTAYRGSGAVYEILNQVRHPGALPAHGVHHRAGPGRRPRGGLSRIWCCPPTCWGRARNGDCSQRPPTSPSSCASSTSGGAGDTPILVGKYLMGREVEVDDVFDGEELLIPGIMEHIERAGVHSGDSISVYPHPHRGQASKQTILKYTYDLSKALGVVGLVNIQFVIYDDQVYVIEVNPAPPYHPLYLQGHGVPIIDLATRVMLGQKLRDLGYGTASTGRRTTTPSRCRCSPSRSSPTWDTGLGPEMRVHRRVPGPWPSPLPPGAAQGPSGGPV